jgi:hypothetical protein
VKAGEGRNDPDPDFWKFPDIFPEDDSWDCDRGRKVGVEVEGGNIAGDMADGVGDCCWCWCWCWCCCCCCWWCMYEGWCEDSVDDVAL